MGGELGAPFRGGGRPSGLLPRVFWRIGTWGSEAVSVYLISYKLAFWGLGRDSTKLPAEIQKLGDWCHYVDAWLVRCDLSADQIFERLQAHLIKPDKLLVIEVKRNYAGWLPEEAWEWIRSHVWY